MTKPAAYKVTGDEKKVLVANPGAAASTAKWWTVESFLAHEDGAIYGVYLVGYFGYRRAHVILDGA